jgi:urease accessory protein
MTRMNGNLIRIATLATGLLPALALAHPGHSGDASFAAGLLHPLGGIDHAGGFILVGLLAAQLGRRYVVPMAGALLGLLVASWTAESDGWNYAAGFMLGGIIWIAAGVMAARAMRVIARRPGKTPAGFPTGVRV